MDAIWIQLIGLCGTGLVLLSYQFRSAKILFLLQGIGCMCFAVHFYLLGAYAGMALNLAGVIRGLVMAQAARGVPWANRRAVRWALPLLFLLAAIPSVAEGWRIILPISGSFVETIAQIRKRPREIRLTKILYSSPVWIAYNAMTHSLSGVLTEGINIVSVVVSIFRFGLDTLDMAERPQKPAKQA